MESLAKASTLTPSAQCSLLLAQAYQNLGQFKEAIVEYKKLDIDQSKNKMIPFNLGLCLLNTGDNINAIEGFNIAVQLDESFIAAWGNMPSHILVAMVQNVKRRDAFVLEAQEQKVQHVL